MNELKELIWIEKYRPATLSEVILTDENRRIIENNIKGSINSFIFYSIKPGTGKTSTAKAIINDLDTDKLVTIRKEFQLVNGKLKPSTYYFSNDFIDEQYQDLWNKKEQDLNLIISNLGF